MIDILSKRTTLLLMLALAPAAALRSQDYYPPPDAKGGWRTLQDADKIRSVAGLDSQNLHDAFEYVQHTNQHGGLLVVTHGWPAYERHFRPGKREALPARAACRNAFPSIP